MFRLGVSKEPTGRSMAVAAVCSDRSVMCAAFAGALARRCSPARNAASVAFQEGTPGDHRHTLLAASIFPFVYSFHYALSYQLHCNRCTSHRHTSYTTQLSTYDTNTQSYSIQIYNYTPTNRCCSFFTAQGKATKDRPSFSCLKDHGAFLLQATQRILYNGVGERGERGRRVEQKAMRKSEGEVEEKAGEGFVSPLGGRVVYRSAGAGSKNTCRAIWSSVSIIIGNREVGYIQPMYPPQSRRYPR